tara:strand:+ start:5027 stop:5293 length:267 start_codon:yes stop_codon:yes gene_type:complete
LKRDVKSAPKNSLGLGFFGAANLGAAAASASTYPATPSRNRPLVVFSTASSLSCTSPVVTYRDGFLGEGVRNRRALGRAQALAAAHHD